MNHAAMRRLLLAALATCLPLHDAEAGLWWPHTKPPSGAIIQSLKLDGSPGHWTGTAGSGAGIMQEDDTVQYGAQAIEAVTTDTDGGAIVQVADTSNMSDNEYWQLNGAVGASEINGMWSLWVKDASHVKLCGSMMGSVAAGPYTCNYPPKPSTAYSGGGSLFFGQKAIGVDSEPKYQWVEENNHTITIGAATGSRAGIKDVVFCLDSSANCATVTQQTVDPRTGVQGFAVLPLPPQDCSGVTSIAGVGKAGTANLFYTVEPVNGLRRSGVLPLTMGCAGQYTRPQYYVDRISGSDSSGDGKTPATAWQTLYKPSSLSTMNGAVINVVARSGTATIQSGAHTIVTWNDPANNLQPGATVSFSTTGKLPDGMTAGQVYYVVNENFIAGQQFEISANPPTINDGNYAFLQSGQQSNTTGQNNCVFADPTYGSVCVAALDPNVNYLKRVAPGAPSAVVPDLTYWSNAFSNGYWPSQPLVTSGAQFGVQTVTGGVTDDLGGTVTANSSSTQSKANQLPVTFRPWSLASGAAAPGTVTITRAFINNAATGGLTYSVGFNRQVFDGFTIDSRKIAEVNCTGANPGSFTFQNGRIIDPRGPSPVYPIAGGKPSVLAQTFQIQNAAYCSGAFTETVVSNWAFNNAHGHLTRNVTSWHAQDAIDLGPGDYSMGIFNYQATARGVSYVNDISDPDAQYPRNEASKVATVAAISTYSAATSTNFGSGPINTPDGTTQIQLTFPSSATVTDTSPGQNWIIVASGPRAGRAYLIGSSAGPSLTTASLTGSAQSSTIFTIIGDLRAKSGDPMVGDTVILAGVSHPDQIQIQGLTGCTRYDNQMQPGKGTIENLLFQRYGHLLTWDGDETQGFLSQNVGCPLIQGTGTGGSSPITANPITVAGLKVTFTYSQNAIVTRVASNPNPAALNQGDSFTVGNGLSTGTYSATITVGPDGSLSGVAALINAAAVNNISASVVGGQLIIANAASGSVVLGTGSGTPLTTLGLSAKSYGGLGDASVRPFDNIYVGTESGSRIPASGAYSMPVGNMRKPLEGRVQSVSSDGLTAMLAPGSNIPDGTYTAWAHGNSFKDVAFVNDWLDASPDLYYQLQGGAIHLVFQNSTLLGGIAFSPRTPSAGQYNEAVTLFDNAMISVRNASGTPADNTYKGLAVDNNVFVDAGSFNYGTNISSIPIGTSIGQLPKFNAFGSSYAAGIRLPIKTKAAHPFDYKGAVRALGQSAVGAVN